MITFKHKGDFSKTLKYFEGLSKKEYLSKLAQYGQKGVEALSKATPIDTGKTASSWSYRIENLGDHATITWENSNIQDGVPIAILIQYGHGTRNGTYVPGRDYINPAIQPILDEISEEIRREVSS